MFMMRAGALARASPRVGCVAVRKVSAVKLFHSTTGTKEEKNFRSDGTPKMWPGSRDKCTTHTTQTTTMNEKYAQCEHCGRLSLEEWKEHYGTEKGFAEHDKDGDGFVDRHELLIGWQERPRVSVRIGFSMHSIE